MKILCFDDNADGRAYLTEVADSIFFLHLATFIPYLQNHDHVCIVKADTYYKYGDADFSTYAPYAITLEAGEKLNVNKL